MDAQGCAQFTAFATALTVRAGIILSGSPYSVYDEDAPRVDPAVFTLGVPVLGICYGLQEIAASLGGKVEPHDHREYGHARVSVNRLGGDGRVDKLFEGLGDELEVRSVLTAAS